MNFNTWMEETDRCLKAISGFSSEDLADQPYWDWWHGEMSPEDAAKETLANEGFPLDVYKM